MCLRTSESYFHLHMKAIASSCIFPMILKSSPKYFTAFPLRVASIVSSSHIFLCPHHDIQTLECTFCCVNNSDWIFQKHVKTNAVDPERSVQGSLCLHLVSLSRSVLGKAMLLDLSFLNQIPSEILFCLKTLVGGLAVHNQIWRTLFSSSFQLYLKKKTLSQNFQLSSLWSGQSQGYLGILKFDLVELLMFWGTVG